MFMVQYIESSSFKFSNNNRSALFTPTPWLPPPPSAEILVCDPFRIATGAGTESSDSTLAANHLSGGRAALDAVTRIILDCASSGIYAAGLPSGEEKLRSVSGEA